MTHQDLTEFPRMTAAQIREVLAAVEQRKHSNAPYPDCFVCGAPVADHLTGPWVGGEGEALRTVRPCGHRMTYNTETVEQIKRELEAHATAEATEGTELDKAKVYLVPVAHLGLQDEPDLVHLALYSWVDRIDAWATELGICGRSTDQGPLPEGTAVTCPGCLQRQPQYERVLESANRADELQAAARRQQALDGNTVENGAWFAVWLESGKWRWTTSKMTTEQREYAADRVAAYSKYLAAVDGDLERQEPWDLRWWRDDR